ncbi:DEKNAAC100257 [Brettanomyces naardenensis]|uniref:DEKNAAC100257 n=1 Tax=Brettanomyces naardenensis TaxID=13370 RepID=A0A448YFD0_BRENA|nr:DEKNAAC100257 [Brettanomyces naardenensis]
MPDYERRFGDWNSASNSYKISVVRTGLIVSIFSMGAAFGGITLGKLGDLYGRKIGILITVIVYLIGCIIQISSQYSWIQYFIGRIVTGLGVGSTLVLCPLLISETAPRAIRGTLVCLFQVADTFGIFIGYIVCYGTYHNYMGDSRSWRIPIGLGFAWSLLILVGLIFTPESPRYLVKKGEIEAAKRSLAKSRRISANSEIVLMDLNILINSVENERLAGKASWRYYFTGKPKIFQRMMIGCLIESLQVLSGNTYFFYYGTSNFKSVGLTDSYMTSIILGLDNFVSTFVAFYIIDHLGRRMTLMLGSAGMIICLIVYSTVGVVSLYPKEYGVDANKYAGDIMILFCCLYIFSFASTWGPTSYVIVSEMYGLRIREQAIAMATAWNWIWGFLISFFTPIITNRIHFAYGYVYVGTELTALIYVYFFLPETKGMRLEDVDKMYEAYVPGLAYKSP